MHRNTQQGKSIAASITVKAEGNHHLLSLYISVKHELFVFNKSSVRPRSNGVNDKEPKQEWKSKERVSDRAFKIKPETIQGDSSRAGPSGKTPEA
ncbi:hypothetical protein K1719_034760 [Acacia pycnantha]|nr:hypothetical protein K1719_034760 [Acacia pycnantha]